MNSEERNSSYGKYGKKAESDIIKLEQTLAKLEQSKEKHLVKISEIEKKIEQIQMKMKSIKTDSILVECEKRNFSMPDYMKLSQAVSDGSLLEFLGIEEKTLKKESADEKEEKNENS